MFMALWASLSEKSRIVSLAAVSMLFSATIAFAGASTPTPASDVPIPPGVPIEQNSPPLQTLLAPPGDASIAGFIPTSLAPKPVASITIGAGAVLKTGELLIADVITYDGTAVAVQVPSGWQLIRDDISPTTRQSLYMHVADADDQPTEWKFNQPAIAQGGLLILNNAATFDPVDTTAGMTGPKDATYAPGITTADDGDLILVFFATDFGGIAPGPYVPETMIAIANQDADPDTYWILGSYQSQRGDIPQADCPTPQLDNGAAAQVAIRRQ
jgi:hypothetical protein